MLLFDKLADKKITYLGYESGHRPALVDCGSIAFDHSGDCHTAELKSENVDRDVAHVDNDLGNVSRLRREPC